MNIMTHMHTHTHIPCTRTHTYHAHIKMETDDCYRKRLPCQIYLKIDKMKSCYFN